uniref:VPS9 domain-containing protein n=1 Tax=Quercus lobata TaxID=97700 RepID=A0A7N2MG57_QUELO
MEAAPSSSSTSTSTSTSSGGSVTFYDFLDRMRNPASLDLVRSIKSFIVSFSFYTPNPDNDGKKVQDFYLSMEAAIREHPLWAAATFEELDSAMEGLEKYVMTKLFSRTFASVPEDAKIDREVSEKICLLQTFLKPEHLDIPAVLHNEASWLLAEKELQKINTFKAPREKLLCIMNCCRVINNLLLNASMSENHALAGLDDFLPVLIYVTIKASSPCFCWYMYDESRPCPFCSKNANPPQLHSNLKFIQLYRRQAKLVSEAAYYFTNLVSAKTFIVDLNGKSLSMDEIKFEESMQAARLTQTNRATQIEASPTLQGQTDPTLTRMHDKEKDTSGGSSYPYMDAEAGELTVGDVERLLSLYKDVVTKYTSLYKVVRHLSMSKTEIPHSEGTSFLLTQPEGTNTKIDHQRGN